MVRDGEYEVSSAPIQLMKRVTPIPAHITDCIAPTFLNYEPVLLSQLCGGKNSPLQPDEPAEAIKHSFLAAAVQRRAAVFMCGAASNELQS